MHRLLGTAFQYAVEWGILVKSPVPVDSPKKSTQERTIWTVEEMRAALDSMEDPILHLAVHLTSVSYTHLLLLLLWLCGANGDAIDLTAKLFDLNPRQAAEKLASDFGLDQMCIRDSCCAI